MNGKTERPVPRSAQAEKEGGRRKGDVSEAELPYTIQVGAYKDSIAAREKIAFYHEKGFVAFSEKYPYSGKEDWYRVYIGRYKTREDAGEKALALKHDGYVDTPWIKLIDGSPEESAEHDSPAAQERASYRLDANAPEKSLLYTIQVASYQDPNSALDEVLAYYKRGLEAFQVLTEVPGKGTWYRVYLKRFNSLTDAEREAKLLIEQGYAKQPWIKRIE